MIYVTVRVRLTVWVVAPEVPVTVRVEVPAGVPVVVVVVVVDFLPPPQPGVSSRANSATRNSGLMRKSICRRRRAIHTILRANKASHRGELLPKPLLTSGAALA